MPFDDPLAAALADAGAKCKTVAELDISADLGMQRVRAIAGAGSVEVGQRWFVGGALCRAGAQGASLPASLGQWVFDFHDAGSLTLVVS